MKPLNVVFCPRGKAELASFLLGAEILEALARKTGAVVQVRTEVWNPFLSTPGLSPPFDIRKTNACIMGPLVDGGGKPVIDIANYNPVFRMLTRELELVAGLHLIKPVESERIRVLFVQSIVTRGFDGFQEKIKEEKKSRQLFPYPRRTDIKRSALVALEAAKKESGRLYCVNVPSRQRETAFFNKAMGSLADRFPKVRILFVDISELSSVLAKKSAKLQIVFLPPFLDRDIMAELMNAEGSFTAVPTVYVGRRSNALYSFNIFGSSPKGEQTGLIGLTTTLALLFQHSLKKTGEAKKVLKAVTSLVDEKPLLNSLGTDKFKWRNFFLACLK